MPSFCRMDLETFVHDWVWANCLADCSLVFTTSSGHVIQDATVPPSAPAINDAACCLKLSDDFVVVVDVVVDAVDVVMSC